MSNLRQNSGEGYFSSAGQKPPSTGQKQQQEQKANVLFQQPRLVYRRREMQMGGCLRTSAMRPRGLREISIIPKLARSAECYVRTTWSTSSVSLIQQELRVQELPAGVQHTAGLWDFSSNLKIKKKAHTDTEIREITK